MITTLRLATLLWCWLALVSSASARGGEFEEVRSEARTALIGRLLDLATWCNQNRLFEERDRVWRAVIGIEADNLDARKGLRYARNVDRTWKEPSARPAKNMNAAALEKLPEKRAEAVKPFSEALLQRIRDGEVPLEIRRSVIAEILSVDPDDAEAHEMLGEVQVEDSWVLQETVTAKERRAQIRAAVQNAKEAPPGVLPATPTEVEMRLFDKWKSGALSGTVRILGTGDAMQCEDLANYCRIAGAVFHAVLGAEPNWAAGFGIYIAAGSGEKDALVGGLTDLEASQRESLKRTIGGGIPGTWKIVLFEADERKRVDCGVRHALAHLFQQGWHVGTKHAWVFEGLGLYLTREICGTRLTWFCAGSGVSNESKTSPRGKLIAGDANWMNEAHKLLTRENPVSLAEVLGRDLTTMGLEDVLVSYSLAAYLVEGRPNATPALLKAVGEDVAPAEAIQGALGMTVPELQERLIRWLNERK